MSKNIQSCNSDLQLRVKAIITEVSKGKVKALCEFGEVSAKLKGSFYRNGSLLDMVLVVGDNVWLHYNDCGDSMITEICERRSSFVRTDFSGHAAGYVKTMQSQVLAANFDVVFILASLNQEFNLKRIERYLATVLSSNAKAVIVLTKADLAGDAGLVAAKAEIEAESPRKLPILHVSEGIVDPRVVLGLNAAAEDDLAARPSHHDGHDDHDENKTAEKK